MSTSGRRKNTSVIARLTGETRKFSFVQAVRLLERSAVFGNRANTESRNALEPGRFAPPTKESIRFSNNNGLAFPESEVAAIEEQSSGSSNRLWKLVTNFIGLTGAMGVLPFHYSELILKRLKKRDRAMASYLDLFHHRTTSLFYQASIKYRLPLQYESTRLDREPDKKRNGEYLDNHTFALLSCIGLSSGHLTNRSQIPDEALIYYGGLLSLQVRTADGLRQIIQDYFGVPVSIEEFVGQWQELIDDVRTRLPFPGHPLGQNACLGRNSMLGKRGWFAQGKVRIAIGPLTQDQHQSFAPGGKGMQALNDVSRAYLGNEREYEFEVLVNRKDINTRVALSKEEPPIMGWSTWLSGEQGERTQNNQNLMKITVSSNR